MTHMIEPIGSPAPLEDLVKEIAREINPQFFGRDATGKPPTQEAIREAIERLEREYPEAMSLSHDEKVRVAHAWELVIELQAMRADLLNAVSNARSEHDDAKEAEASQGLNLLDTMFGRANTLIRETLQGLPDKFETDILSQLRAAD